MMVAELTDLDVVGDFAGRRRDEAFRRGSLPKHSPTRARKGCTSRRARRRSRRSAERTRCRRAAAGGAHRPRYPCAGGLRNGRAYSRRVRIPLEICPTSNRADRCGSQAIIRIRTSSSIAPGCIVTIDADDPAMFQTSIAQEYALVERRRRAERTRTLRAKRDRRERLPASSSAGHASRASTAACAELGTLRREVKELLCPDTRILTLPSRSRCT